MAARNVSPGGALLRASRMFSLPAPLPPPPNDSSAGTNFSSDTATLAFPTYQAITTLGASRKQGDWGFKRALPLKTTTKASKPMIRLKAIDTIEQITDFGSATNHGITLLKFQELGMPLTARRPAGGADKSSGRTSLGMLPQRSVFEEEIDVTDIPPSKRAQTADTRWKFTGPWLAGMTQGEFNKWLAREVRPRRAEFREFLKTKLAGEMHEAAAKQALDKGEAQPAPIDPSSVTEDQLIDYLRKLRNHNQALYEMVGQFLDLAPLNPPVEVSSIPEGSAPVEVRASPNPYAESGPPCTHPSAGLSYLRTSMYMTNHPIYGPQQQKEPVQARVLTPRKLAQGAVAKLGVAGFVVNTALGDTASNTRNARDLLLDRIDPDIVGGAKVWVQPQRAAVDSNGRVIMNVIDPQLPEAVLVAQELTGDAACLGVQPAQRDMDRVESQDEIRQRFRMADSPAMSSARDYGVSLRK